MAKNKTRFRGRRRVKRQYRRAKPSSYALSNNTTLNPIAQKYRCKMKIVDNFLMGNGVTPALIEYYRLNSVYDPYSGTGGHQPYGYDQLSQLYSRYRVYKVSWTVNMTYTDESKSLFFGALPIPESTIAITSISDFCEKPRCRWVKQTNRTGAKMLKGHVYLPKLAGMTPEQYRTDDKTGAESGTNPAIPLNIAFFCSNLDEATPIDNNDVNIMLQLTYHLEWYDPIIQAQS